MENNTLHENASGDCDGKDAKKASFPRKTNLGRTETAKPEIRETAERLRFDLLREQVAAEGHAAIESDRGEVGAAAEFILGPGANLGSDAPAERL